MRDPAEMLHEQHEQLALLTRKATKLAKKAVAEVLVDLEAEIARIPGEEYGGWTTAAQRAVEVQLRAAHQQLVARAATAFISTHNIAAARAYAAARRWFRELDKQLLGAIRPLRFDLVNYLSREENFLVNHYPRSLSYWGRNLSTAMREVIADQSLIGKSWVEAAKVMQKRFPELAVKKRWMLERVAATEMSNAYNGTTWQALRASDRPGDRMYKRLVATFDHRTGEDSRILDGQTVPVNEPFINVTGREYQHPPNRPRDREVVVGWRESYGRDLKFDDVGGRSATVRAERTRLGLRRT